MNKTDSPLKRLVQMAPLDFAEWILGTEVKSVTTANIELQPNPNPAYTDLVFWVTIDGGKTRLLLHIEFQGESSKRPMRFRVLDYVVGFADKERATRIHSVVFYVGEKTNITDTGHHQVMGIGERVTLAWQYDVIRLWDLDPMVLLAENRPALLPLLGQAKLERPDEIMPLVYEAIKSVPNEELQHNLLIELLALLQDEEVIQMIETMITQDEWVFDSPYLRRWRQRVEDARVEGLRKVDEERRKASERQRQNILHMVALRYNPHVQEHKDLQDILEKIIDDAKFRMICEAIISVEDFHQFYAKVQEIAEAEQVTLMAFA